MTRTGEQDFLETWHRLLRAGEDRNLETGPRVARALQLENQPVTDQRTAWVDYLAHLAERGGSR